MTDSRLQTDPTGTIDLSNPAEVIAAIDEIMAVYDGWDRASLIFLHSVTDLVAAFSGDYPGLLACDTWYHDLRHALDSGLAMARLLSGYKKSQATANDLPQIDTEFALLGLLLALFHDIGLLRRSDEAHLQGAELTPIHERRSIEFAQTWLAQTELAHFADKAELIMVTRLADAVSEELTGRDRMLANLFGTADLMAQLADRCYLEKSRDFLFVELQAAGLAGSFSTPYPSPQVLLEKTPSFYAEFLRERMEHGYQHAYLFMQVYFGGECPYMAAIDRNFRYLDELLAKGTLAEGLRRLPLRVVSA